MKLKVNKQLILESVFQKAIDWVKGISTNKLDNFIKEYFSSNSKKILNEAQVFKPSKRIEGTTNMNDSCYTAIMKLIGREDLLKSTLGSGGKFMERYEKIAKPIKLTKQNAHKLKKGNIILPRYEPETGFKIKLNDHYDTNGVSNKNGWTKSVAHFVIVIDPKKYLILHNSVKSKVGNIPGGIGQRLELLIEAKPKLFNDPASTSVVLDMNVIDKMK